MSIPCNDLLIGGTLGTTEITGGLSVSNRGISVRDFAALWGAPRQRGVFAAVSGAAGSTLTGDRLPAERLITLPLFISDRDPTTGLLAAPTAEEQVQDNLDDVNGIVHRTGGFLIEWVTPDGTSRYLHAFQNGQALIAPTTTSLLAINRAVAYPAVAPYPYWRNVVRVVDTISGTDTISVAGNVPVFDATIIFAGNGTFTNNTTGQVITVAGASGAVTVKTGDGRTVVQAGVPARNLVTVTDDEWMRFPTGTVSITTTVSCDIQWRPGWA